MRKDFLRLKTYIMAMTAPSCSQRQEENCSFWEFVSSEFSFQKKKWECVQAVNGLPEKNAKNPKYLITERKQQQQQHIIRKF